MKSSIIEGTHMEAITDNQISKGTKMIEKISLGTLSFIIGIPILGILFALLMYKRLRDQPRGTKDMKRVNDEIKKGAEAFLREQDKVAILTTLVISALLFLTMDWNFFNVETPIPFAALSFALGSATSMIMAYVGMHAATDSNVRVLNITRKDGKLVDSFRTGFDGGSVTGVLMMSIGTLGVIGLLLWSGDPELIIPFGFGASLIALFVQVGGGIYTKSSDVGADLVGKVERELPEDDPRNPAVIADQVGDNVGDCAGRSTDLYESFVDNMIALMVLSLLIGAFPEIAFGGRFVFPLLIAAAAILYTIAGVLATRLSDDPEIALNFGYGVTTVLALVSGSLIFIVYLSKVILFIDFVIGLITAYAVILVVQYYTGTKKPVKEIAECSKSGPAINILRGTSAGLESSAMIVAIIGVAMFGAYTITYTFAPATLSGVKRILWGFFGVAVATLGKISINAIVVASDSYGPIVDNAAGIATASGIKGGAREEMDRLDSIGNTTKALTKGFAMVEGIFSAVTMMLTYIFLLKSHTGKSIPNIFEKLSLVNPMLISAVFLGGVVPTLFSALILKSTTSGANEMVKEVRRQFEERPGILDNYPEVTPNYERAIKKATDYGLKGMVVPALLGILAPLVLGFALGAYSIVPMMIGIKLVGITLAIYFYNAGGAWDNAKKYIETGKFDGKGSDAHAAAVAGDTVGDPLKDAAGPSLHILIKLSNIVSLTFISLFILF